MKTSGSCPKCSNRRLIHVTQVADVSHSLKESIEEAKAPGPKSLVAVAWRIARTGDDASFWKGETVVLAGLMEAVVCRACGFTELYAKDADQIPVDGEIVKELVVPDQGPFR